MKKTNLKKAMMTVLVAVMAMVNATPLMAQQKVADDYLVGTWVMESMKWEGSDKNLCNSNYSQVKVYRANGEYACAEIVKANDGSARVLPHEYGTYTLKNGRYSEMGRPEVEDDAFVVVDKNTTKGRWMNRHDVWKRTSLPDKLVDYIVAQCKAKQEGDPKDIQQMIKTHILNK
ncbi:MAG: lipocalin family protein [Prevotellaceae bacterium]|nr:lipocalin family protein [Prevotellaceae bacterium]